MSKMKKYLELNSMYRNRNNYPNPASFCVNISQRGTRNQLTALDPISYAYPIIFFNGFGIGTSLNDDYVVCEYNVPSTTSGIVNLSTNTKFVVTATTMTLNRRDNYYTGCAIVGTGTEPILNQTRRITEFLYLNTFGTAPNTKDYFSITVDIPFDNFTTSPQSFTIYNPSDFSDTTNMFLFIPTSVNIDNYITNYYVYNYTQCDYAKIISFDGTTHIAKLGIQNSTNTWTIDDYFSVGKESVSVNGTLSYGAVALLKKVNEGFGYPPDAINVKTTTNSTAGSGLTISWVNGNNGEIPDLVSIDYPGTKYIIGDTITVPYENILGSSYTTFIVVGVYPSPGNIVFSEPINSSYINSFIRIFIQTPPFDSIPIQQIVSISDNIAFLKDTTYIQPPFPTYVPEYFLYLYSTDNSIPLIYTGSIITNSQPGAYYVSLISLSLPNQPLVSGGRISGYSFVYVEFENVSTSSSGVKNLIYSNNPNTYKAVFRVSIQELIHPEKEIFTRNTAFEMPQIIIFKQTDDIQITITTPDGQVFQTVQADRFNGPIPNQFLQISALFSIQRL